MPLFSCIIEEQITDGLRLDRYVSENLRLLSRSQIKARNLKAKVNGKNVKISRLVKQGDSLELFWDDEPPQFIVPQDIPLEIIFENERCIAINKAQGMVVHPGAGNKQGTLANAILFRMKKNGLESTGVRPGIVHRLDKDTSGVIIAAYDEEAHAFLARQFKNRSVRKIYIAIVCGTPKEKKGRIENFIARDQKDRKKFTVCKDGETRGKKALTFYKVIKSSKNYSLVILRPKTGRTHQLRAHMRHLGCPILGDPIYGSIDKNFPKASLMLHAKSLEIIIPGETEVTFFNTLVPKRFKEVFAF